MKDLLSAEVGLGDEPYVSLHFLGADHYAK